MDQSIEDIKGASPWHDAWKRLLKNSLAVFGLIVLIVMILAVIVGPSIIEWTTGYTYDLVPSQHDLVKAMPPSISHPFGTDDLGRDLLARVLQGGRISLMVGIISTFVSLVVGVSYGAIAGYLGGKMDNLMMRIVDIIYAIPYMLIVIVLLAVFGGPNTKALVTWIPQIVAGSLLLILGILLAVRIYRKIVTRFSSTAGLAAQYLLKGLLIVILAATLFGIIYFSSIALGSTSLGPSLANWYGTNLSQGVSQIFLLFFALGLVSWLTMARVVRGQILSLKNQEFVIAAKATGVSPFMIIFRHLIPNALGPVIVYATLTVPAVMLTEAFLSYLGLGVQAPYASWGSLSLDGVKNLAIFPWQLIFPGVTMALTLFSLNFLGDGIRDALDPQTRKF
ncbi:MAG: ABC transporter permease [Acidobacteriota bacterium]